MLTEWIRSRRVDFPLSDNLRKEIQDAGASEELLATIQLSAMSKSEINPSENTRDKKQRLERMLALDKAIRESVAQNKVEMRKRLIALGIVFLIEYECDGEAPEMAEYLRKWLPSIKEKLDRMQKD